MCKISENGHSVSTRNNEMNYDDAFELSGHGWYNRFALVACSIISNAVALDMFGFSIVVAAARCDLNLGIEETGLLASAPFAGLLFAFPWGYYADMHGRRKALLLSTSIGFLFAALGSLATSWQVMLALKLIGCSFSTPAFTFTIAYLGECTTSKHRSQYLFIMNSMNLASEMVSFSLAYLILPLTFNVPMPWLSIAYRSWRLYVLVLALPLGVGAVMMFFLKESPKFLANIGQTDEALRVMKRIHTINGGRDEFPVNSLKTIETQRDVSLWRSVVQQTVPLFKPPLLSRTLQLFFLMAICCSTNNAFIMWFPTIVNIFFNSPSTSSNNTVGFCERIVDSISASETEAESVICNDTISLNAIYSGIILGVTLTLLNLSVTRFASYRRLVLVTFLLIPSISCLMVGMLEQPLASLVFFALIQASAVGIGNVASYFVDLYPTSYRGLATSLAVMAARLTSLVSVIIIGAVIVDYCSLTFYFWAVLTLCGVGVSLFLPPDKKTNTVQPENSARMEDST
ncbi:uncharacterized protein [Epargyreus clarus]|uniref:uncharacterized protein n=1 Tax=Epargyreus clarus TaxID=520877 RepID=UPI003C2EE103